MPVLPPKTTVAACVIGRDVNDDDDDDDVGDNASSSTSDGVDNRNHDNRNHDNRIDGNDACASAKVTTLAARPLSRQGDPWLAIFWNERK
jgi:hypothetical protein